MNNMELQDIWNAQDQKLERLLSINKDIAIDLTRSKLNKQMSRLYRPKWTAILIGVPYTLLLIAITVIATLAKAYFVALGFGAISLIMLSLLISYFYHLYLISQVKSNEDVLSTQRLLSKLRISSFNTLRLAIFQLPFWSICWISMNALIESPFIYGGVNLLIFLALSYLAYWLYQKVSYKNTDSRFRKFFLSGREWDPILKSAELLEQIKGYQK